MDSQQLTEALQRQMVGHPYLHAAFIYVLLLLTGILVGFPYGMFVGMTFDKFSKRCLDWIGDWIGARLFGKKQENK